MRCKWKGNGKATLRHGEKKLRKNEGFGLKYGFKEIHSMLSWELQIIVVCFFNCWNINYKDDGMAVDVGKGTKLFSKILFLILKLGLILFMKTYFLIVRTGSINRQNE